MPDTCLVVGGAGCVFDDLAKAGNMFRPDCIIAINDIMTRLPRVDHAVTMHPEKMHTWLEQRQANGFSEIVSFWTGHDKILPKSSLPYKKFKNNKGGSGLLAVEIAMYLGFTKIILAGIPLEARQGHFFDDFVWRECILYRVVWEHRGNTLPNVRSFSGWTKEQYGEPTLEWILEEAAGH